MAFLKFIPAACYSPTGEPRSTLAAVTLHCRVRNGDGCYLHAMATGKVFTSRSWKREHSFWRYIVFRDRVSRLKLLCFKIVVKPHG